MSDEGLTAELITDLLRSSWVVEEGRRRTYDQWALHDSRFEESCSRAAAKAELIEPSLAHRGRAPDHDLIEGHAAWIRRLLGADPAEVELSELFLARLGDWVTAHACPFLLEGADVLQRLGQEEQAALRLPEALPPPPPTEPFPSAQVSPPGPLLFRFGLLSDLHVGSPLGEAMARAAVNDLNASGAELVVQLGDLTNQGEKEEFELAAEILQGLTMPFATIIGNHDVYSKKEERLSGREYFSSVFGREPEGTIFEHGGFRFAALDSAEQATSPFPPFDLVSGTFMEGRGGAIVRGSLTVAQHEILAEVAAPKSGPAFVFLHHPPQPFAGFPPILFGLRDQDSGRLRATCDSGNVWGIFAGHTHRNARSNFGPVPVQEVAIPRDYPFGYALVDVTSEGYAYRFIQLSNQELVAKAGATTGAIQRRYGEGSGDDLAFTWRRIDQGVAT